MLQLPKFPEQQKIKEDVMSLAMVSRSKQINAELFARVLAELPYIIARNLDVPDEPSARLFPTDIEVRAQESPWNIMHRDIEVVVFATRFDSRVKDGEIRSENMVRDLLVVLPQGLTGFIWVCFTDAFFSEF